MRANPRDVITKLKDYGWKLRHDPNCTSGEYVAHIFRKGITSGALSIAVLVVNKGSIRISWTGESYGSSSQKYDIRNLLIDDLLRILQIDMTVQDLYKKVFLNKSKAYRDYGAGVSY